MEILRCIEEYKVKLGQIKKYKVKAICNGCDILNSMIELPIVVSYWTSILSVFIQDTIVNQREYEWIGYNQRRRREA